MIPPNLRMAVKTCYKYLSTASHSAAQESSSSKYLAVMPREVNNSLKPKDGSIYLDMTFGCGGHTSALLASGKDIKVIALDRDPVAYERSIQLAHQTNYQVLPLLGKWSEAPQLLSKMGIQRGMLNGIIIDVGPSVLQEGDASRGFNAQKNGPLDMRMDGDRIEGMATAADVLNTLDSEQLSKIFRLYGEEKLGKKVASAIVDARFMMMSMKTTDQLKRIILSMMEESSGAQKLMTAIFRALRMFVNNELNELNYAIEKMREFLVLDPNITKLDRIQVKKWPPTEEEDEVNEEEENDKNALKSGVMSVITTCSTEDRIVKDHFLSSSIDDDSPYTQRLINELETPTAIDMSRVALKKWLPLQRHVIFPDQDEILSNPRSRPCKLRCAMRAY